MVSVQSNGIWGSEAASHMEAYGARRSADIVRRYHDAPEEHDLFSTLMEEMNSRTMIAFVEQFNDPELAVGVLLRVWEAREKGPNTRDPRVRQLWPRLRQNKRRWRSIADSYSYDHLNLMVNLICRSGSTPHQLYLLDRWKSRLTVEQGDRIVRALSEMSASTTQSPQVQHSANKMAA